MYGTLRMRQQHIRDRINSLADQTYAELLAVLRKCLNLSALAKSCFSELTSVNVQNKM